MVAIKAGMDKKLLFQEAGWQAMLHSKYFPTLFDCMEVGRQICLIMEYVEGENLLQRKKRIGRYTEKEVVAIAMQVVEAIGELHGGKVPCVYGDIKPENILMQKNGRIKVVDLGSVVPLQTSGNSGLHFRGGTPAFAAPEQWKEPPDIRNDIYGLGILMQKMLSQGGKLSCNPHVLRIIERCTQKQKEKRFSTIEQLRKLFAK